MLRRLAARVRPSARRASEALHRAGRLVLRDAGDHLSANRHERPFHSGVDASALEAQLRPLARRLRTRRTLEYVPHALLLAACLALATSVLGRGFDVPGLIALGFLLALALAAGAVWRVARRSVGPYEVARHTDAALSLRARLATALELLDSHSDGMLPRRQVQDALAAAGHASPKRAFPLFPPGSAARRTALRRTGTATLAMVGAVLLAVWPSVAPAALPAAEEEKLALAETRSREEQLRPRIGELDADPNGGGIDAHTERPEDVGDTQGMLGSQQPDPNRGSQPGEANQPGRGEQAAQDAQNQQNPNAAERQQALQDLANALRQSQSARQASDALRRNDTQRAAQALNQIADQVRNLSPGERQTLAQAFSQASQQIGERDRPLADAARRAAEALSQFRNQDAQAAIRDAAKEVQNIGQQAQQQQDLQRRQQDLQQGAQPQLPSQQSPALAQPPRGDQRMPQAGTQNAQQAPASRQGGDGPMTGGGLSELEASLRAGGLQGSAGGGDGAGTGGGSQQEGQATRLGVDARMVTVEAEVRDGPSQWRPPNPNAAPAAPGPAAASPLPAGPVSSAPVGAGADVNSVPWDLAGSVRQYFTPDQRAP